MDKGPGRGAGPLFCRDAAVSLGRVTDEFRSQSEMQRFRTRERRAAAQHPAINKALPGAPQRTPTMPTGCAQEGGDPSLNQLGDGRPRCGCGGWVPGQRTEPGHYGAATEGVGRRGARWALKNSSTLRA